MTTSVRYKKNCKRKGGQEDCQPFRMHRSDGNCSKDNGLPLLVETRIGLGRLTGTPSFNTSFFSGGTENGVYRGLISSVTLTGVGRIFRQHRSTGDSLLFIMKVSGRTSILLQNTLVDRK